MKNTFVRIEKKVPLTIFENPSIKEHSDQLFCSMKPQIKTKITNVLEFLNLGSNEQLSFDNIFHLFKCYFYKQILNEAVEITLIEEGKTEILSNIISLLSEEKLKNAIKGRPMIDAFKKAIRSIPRTRPFEACIYGCKILLLELESYRFDDSSFNKKTEFKYQNYCSQCSCLCYCNRDCEGDTTKCTSEKALKTNCNHCCDCYLVPMAENIRKKNYKKNEDE